MNAPSYLPVALAFALAMPAVTHAEVGALQTNCALGGKQPDGSYQFVATCAGRSISPDGRFAIVQQAYEDKQPTIVFQNNRGHVLTKLPDLSDDMPFSVRWAPNSRWFYVNHHVGSFMDELHVFDIKDNHAVEKPSIVAAAIRIATERYPCLAPDMVLPNGIKWTSDSRSIILVTISAPYACSKDFSKHPGTWHSLWMIGDVASGQIEGDSIRVQPDDKPFSPPSSEAYSR